MLVEFLISINTRATQITMISDNENRIEKVKLYSLQEICDVIYRHLRFEHNLLVSNFATNKVLQEIGSALPIEVEKHYRVMGRNLITGQPDRVELTSQEIRLVIQPVLIEIIISIVKEIRELISHLENVDMKSEIRLHVWNYTGIPTKERAFAEQNFKIERLDERLQEVLRVELGQDFVVEYDIWENSSE